MLRGDSGNLGLLEQPTVSVISSRSGQRLYSWELKRLPLRDEHEEVRAQIVPAFCPFRLPGEINFQNYLRNAWGGGLKVARPRDARVPYFQTRKEGKETIHTLWKAWEIYDRYSNLVGTYFVGPMEATQNGKINFRRRYEGRIRDKVNYGAIEHNRETDGEFIPIDTFHLVFGYRKLIIPTGTATEIIYERFDGHTDIPFP